MYNITNNTRCIHAEQLRKGSREASTQGPSNFLGDRLILKIKILERDFFAFPLPNNLGAP